ncbi:hydantoinase/oxoprolinase family protein [Roseovarius aestuarii]|nr:hydantoinase/oxoprolinase family protein [Roseovarius aestuarii]
MTDSNPHYRFGADIGGTFTDVLLIDDTSGKLVALKVPSNRPTPEQSIIDGLITLRDEHGVDPAEVAYFSHGTTLGVNTLLERDGVDVGLLTTQGFRDILELRRLRLPKANDLYVPRPISLAPRRHVIEVAERIGQDGEVIIPLDRDDVLTAAGTLISQGVKDIAICFMHSYRFSDHELQAKAWIEEAYPDAYVIASSDLWPQQREYERCLVSVINAYIGARMRGCFDALQSKASAIGFNTRIFSTKSNGGVMGLAAAGAQPVETLLSGPASGVIGASYLGKVMGEDKLITLDMGGTSVDIAMIDGEIPYSNENTIGEYPVLIPAVDVSAIGAGGGSVAWLDPEGVLKVGPRSAGAYPGPACYSRGGTEPTVTDAYAALGILPPTGLLGGEMQLDLDKARTALATVGDELGLTPEETADAILQVTTANIYAETLPQLARRGIEAGEFSLLCYGAAGPTHSFLLARELDLKRVIVPPMPGLLCALGCLVADLRADFVKSLWQSTHELPEAELNECFDTLETNANDWLAAQNVDVDVSRLIKSADVCFEGQSFELNIVFPDEPLTVANLERWFRERYRAIYGILDEDTPIRVLEARVQIVGETSKPDIGNLRPFATATEEPVGQRPLYENGKAMTATIYQRTSLQPGQVFDGPAVVEQYDTTIYVPEGFRVTVDQWWNLIGERQS